MAGKVLEQNEIYLGGTYYPLTRPVQSQLASIYPSKIVIGDTTKDSNIRTSIISWSDWRGGIGVERMQGAADVDRAWWSTLNTRHRHHLVLPALASSTASQEYDDTAISGEITFIAELGPILYVGFGNNPYEYKRAGTGIHTSAYFERVTHSSSAYSFSGQPSDSLTVRIGGEDNVVVAYESGYAYFANSTTGESYDTNDVKFLAFWDDRLWGIDKTGQLWYTLSLGGTAYNDAKLPVQDDYVTDLFVGRDATGQQIIYASTKMGLYAHDAFNQKWVATEFQLPYHNFNGTGSIRWRDSIYSPSGLGIYKYINGNNNAVLTVMGPDRDDGVPDDNRGTIKILEGTHTELLAAVDGTTAPEEAASVFAYQQGSTSALSGHVSSVFGDSTGSSSILGWNDSGWETKWVAPTAGHAITAMLVTNAGKGDYRLWWGHNQILYNQMVPFDITNPEQLVNMEYATSGYHETPWFDAQQSEVDKLALRLKVEVQGASSNETVVVEYATDYSTTYESALGTITSNGITTYTFGSNAGEDFRSIKFKLSLAREAGTTTAIMKKSPDVVSLSLEYRKKLDAKWGHAVEVDLNKPYKGNDPKGLRSALVASIESNTLQEFTYRDDSGGTRNYYVDVASATGLEYTGYDERGSSRISLVEP